MEMVNDDLLLFNRENSQMFILFIVLCFCVAWSNFIMVYLANFFYTKKYIAGFKLDMSIYKLTLIIKFPTWFSNSAKFYS